MTELEQVQVRLRAIYGPGHYYTDTYSHQELSYSGRVPHWMQEHIRDCSVLDIGPAYGTLAAYSRILSPDADIVAVDARRYMSDNVIQEFGITFISGDIERDILPYRDFGAVILTEVLEHFNFHPVPTLHKIRGMMAPGGKLFLSTPDAGSWGRVTDLYGSLDEIPEFAGASDVWLDRHVWQYTESELLDVLARAGFRVAGLDYSVSPGGRHFNVMAERA